MGSCVAQASPGNEIHATVICFLVCSSPTWLTIQFSSAEWLTAVSTDLYQSARGCVPSTNTSLYFLPSAPHMVMHSALHLAAHVSSSKICMSLPARPERHCWQHTGHAVIEEVWHIEEGQMLVMTGCHTRHTQSSFHVTKSQKLYQGANEPWRSDTSLHSKGVKVAAEAMPTC